MYDTDNETSDREYGAPFEKSKVCHHQDHFLEKLANPEWKI
jgi:hypothetical protein